VTAPNDQPEAESAMPREGPDDPGDAPPWRRSAAHAHGVLLTVAYDGSAYHGWAAQKNARTVQETLQGAIAALDPRASTARGTSRTDAGVHAEGQLVAFDTARELPARAWVLALNQQLPDDVAVRAARAVPPGFAPRFASRGKRYVYRLVFDRVRDPLQRVRAWRVGEPVDLAKLESEAAAIVGTHDFGAFRAARDPREVTVRTVTRVDVLRDEGERLVRIVVEGNAFLYNMVRILVGTLVDVGRGRRPPGAVARALASRERGDAGMTAPAHGLTLETIRVELPEGAGEPWPH
jgi:tRNA pseudouridine38-40 synthase